MGLADVPEAIELRGAWHIAHRRANVVQPMGSHGELAGARDTLLAWSVRLVAAALVCALLLAIAALAGSGLASWAAGTLAAAGALSAIIASRVLVRAARRLEGVYDAAGCAQIEALCATDAHCDGLRREVRASGRRYLTRAELAAMAEYVGEHNWAAPYMREPAAQGSQA